MLFNSLSFAVFLPIVFIAYWAAPHKFRWILLLAAGYYFYMSWNAGYIFLILFTTVISYTAAILLEKAVASENCVRNRKIILSVAAILCLGMLFFFKYFNFAFDTISKVLSVFSIRLNPVSLKLLLPVGISFYTFQTLGYIIDVYRGETAAERHFGYYAVYVSFFPLLLAGPIERFSHLMPQLKRPKTFDYATASYGLKQMLWGFFKKLVLADTLAIYAGKVFENVTGFGGCSLLLAAVCYTFQIYCDFSGYSDIVLGMARLLEIELLTNFKSPYFSQSVKEFWGRWHISLSNWLRDYVYIPLGGNRVGRLRHGINLMITFLISGLWHGADLSFVVWGGIHGLAQITEGLFVTKNKQRSRGITGVLRCFIVFVFCAFAWIFFAAPSMGDAVYVVKHLFDGITSPVAYLRGGFVDLGMEISTLLALTAGMLLLGIYDFISLKKDVITLISEKKAFVRWTVYVLMALVVIFFSQKGIAAEFVYCQF